MATTRELAAAAQKQATGKVYCTQHQGMADPEGGIAKPFGNKGATRFVCASCAAKWKGGSAKWASRRIA